MTGSRSRVLGWLVGAVVLTAIAAGLYLIGSPADERARRLDGRRGLLQHTGEAEIRALLCIVQGRRLLWFRAVVLRWRTACFALS